MIDGSAALTKLNELLGTCSSIRQLDYKDCKRMAQTTTQFETGVRCIKLRLPAALADKIKVPEDRKKHNRAEFEALKKLAQDELWASIEALAAEAKPECTVTACDAEHEALESQIAALRQRIQLANGHIEEIRKQQHEVGKKRRGVVDLKTFGETLKRHKDARLSQI
jgi:hypothetical protein